METKDLKGKSKKMKVIYGCIGRGSEEANNEWLVLLVSTEFVTS